MVDTKIEINTQQGENSFTTNKLKGELRALIIDSFKPVKIVIDSELGYPILNKSNCMGLVHMMVKGVAYSSAGMPYTDHIDRYYLDEKLIINVEGNNNVDIKILIRVV